ncbi:hypothetical protein UVI_02044010 [Ustilaginoidea virens]|nr:hypothetical protein UVI_02044010 [Ustilaginoidea virens]
MNRPRNRQPRPPRQNHSPGGHQADSTRRWTPSPATTPQQAAGAVPSVQQVVPGASVFVVLKKDQPTGKETAGVVADLLTRGDHPRGIKVRLQNGQVGRVQRMGLGSAAASGAVSPAGGTGVASGSSRFGRRCTDVRGDLDYPSEPPARSLADFLPPTQESVDEMSPGPESAASYVSVRCPVCDVFEGDEAAVSYHVERQHLN